MRFGVVVRVRDHVEAGRREQGTVVFPARIADGDRGVRVQLLEEIGADLQRAGAAQCLSGDHAAFGQHGRFLAEQHFLHGLVIGGNAFHRQIAARQTGGHTLFFRCLHSLEQGQFAFRIEIHANAQVHLIGAVIGVIGFVQAKNGVARGEFDSGKESHFDGSRQVVGKCSGSAATYAGSAQSAILASITRACGKRRAVTREFLPFRHEKCHVLPEFDENTAKFVSAGPPGTGSRYRRPDCHPSDSGNRPTR